MEKAGLHNLIVRYRKAYPFTSISDASNLVHEYRKFMRLKIELKDFNAKKLSPSPKIDQVWHLHILDTKSYALWCGKDFIHHDPSGTGEDQAIKQAKRYTHTYKLLDKESKERVDIWPKPLEYVNCVYTNSDGTLRYQLTVYSDGQHDKNIYDVTYAIETGLEKTKEFTIRVKVPSGVVFTVRDEKIKTVNNLKWRIGPKFEKLPQQFQIIYQSIVLQDDDLIRDVVPSGDLVHAVLNARGC